MFALYEVIIVIMHTFIGIKKGDRIAIYMPMINELVVAMLACARIGAVHSIVVSRLCYYSTGKRNYYVHVHRKCVCIKI